MPCGISLIVKPQHPFHIDRRSDRLLDEMNVLIYCSGSVRIVERERKSMLQRSARWRRVANIVDRRRSSKNFPRPRQNREPATRRKE